jgi:hypothetical protein
MTSELATGSFSNTAAQYLQISECAVAVTQGLLEEYVQKFEFRESSNYLLALELKAITYGSSCVALRLGSVHVHAICPLIRPSKWRVLLGLLGQCAAYQPPIRDVLQPLLSKAVSTDQPETSQKDAIEHLIRKSLAPLCDRLRCLVYLLFYHDGEKYYGALKMQCKMRNELRRSFTSHSPTVNKIIRYFQIWSSNTPRLAALKTGIVGTGNFQHDHWTQPENVISRIVLLRVGQDSFYHSINDGTGSDKKWQAGELLMDDTSNGLETEVIQSGDNTLTRDRGFVHLSACASAGKPKKGTLETAKVSSRRCSACAGVLGEVEHLCRGAIMYQDYNRCYARYNLKLQEIWEIKRSNLVFRRTETCSQSVLELTAHEYQDASLIFDEERAKSSQCQPNMHHVAVTLHGLGRTTIPAMLTSDSWKILMLVTSSAADSPWSETDAAPPPYMLPATPLRQACAIYASVNQRS